MSGIQCEIRYNTLSIEQIVRHYEENGITLPNLNLEEYACKLKANAELVELWHNGKLVGLCACYMNNFEAKGAYISHIAILETYRGLKLGEYLISQVEQKAKSKGFDSMQLEVSKDNTAAYRFYQKMGYEPKEDRGVKLLLRKEL